jgi:hypothetical protein
MASLAESVKYKITISYIQSCIMVLKKNVNAGCVGVFCDAVELCKDGYKGLQVDV